MSKQIESKLAHLHDYSFFTALIGICSRRGRLWYLSFLANKTKFPMLSIPTSKAFEKFPASKYDVNWCIVPTMAEGYTVGLITYPVPRWSGNILKGLFNAFCVEKGEIVWVEWEYIGQGGWRLSHGPISSRVFNLGLYLFHYFFQIIFIKISWNLLNIPNNLN